MPIGPFSISFRVLSCHDLKNSKNWLFLFIWWLSPTEPFSRVLLKLFKINAFRKLWSGPWASSSQPTAILTHELCYACKMSENLFTWESHKFPCIDNCRRYYFFLRSLACSVWLQHILHRDVQRCDLFQHLGWVWLSLSLEISSEISRSLVYWNYTSTLQCVWLPVLLGIGPWQNVKWMIVINSKYDQRRSRK